jgi:hypothetical protein
LFGTAYIPKFLGASIFFVLLFPLHGGAKKEAEKKPLNPEWILTITAFDVSDLPQARQSIGTLLTRKLVQELNSIAHRIRVNREYTFYQEYARSQGRNEAAKRLSAKWGERDALLFQGDPEWRYKKKLKALNKEIRKLEEELKSAEEEIPAIAPEPEFKLSERNQAEEFPAPPQAGLEYQFCLGEKSDAFITGKGVEFHGRLYFTLRLYTRYSQSFEYEDGVIFSIEDTQEGVRELADRVSAAVSGEKPAAVVVHGTPKDAVILLDDSFAGSGEVGPLEHPPGILRVDSFADEHQPLSTSLELHPGELAELYINLQPLSKEALAVTVPDESARLYRGALYLGQTPLDVEIPGGEDFFFHVETPDGKTGSGIHRGGTGSSALFLQTNIPPAAGEGRVAKARRQFYGSWARFWIALPTAFLLQGLSDSQVSAYRNTGYASLYETAQSGQVISIGAWVVFGLVTAEVIYRTVVYIRTAGKTPDPLEQKQIK